ncbi:hypothetical protein DYB36_007446 [Aphanomyces astaci]|uniref:Myb/SANT-like domain-containing protein n=1 Tax=Aphanomyces astaci TaxID=112090 RepID=A0A396ZRE3_APHAT|nr:hypothetical protein DYB36_007446 [Aphanomyces astaci]
MDDTRASWNDEKDATWLTEMIHQAHVLGKSAHSGFKREAWLATLAKLNATHKLKYNVQQLKARHAELKKQYSVACQMVKTSGIGFEAVTCRFVCTEGSWTHFLRDKPKKWALCETKRFPQYPLCQALYDGTLATGEFASSSTQAANHRHQHEDDSSDDFGDDPPSFVMPSEEEKEEDDTSNASDDNNRGRRSAQTPNQKPAKRVRQSLASVMVAKMRAFRENGKEELDVMKKGLGAIEEENKATSPVEAAMDALHDEFEYLLGAADLSFAYEVLENPAKAAQFVRMRGEAREVWLRRHIQTKAREHERIFGGG